MHRHTRSYSTYWTVHMYVCTAAPDEHNRLLLVLSLTAPLFNGSQFMTYDSLHSQYVEKSSLKWCSQGWHLYSYQGTKRNTKSLKVVKPAHHFESTTQSAHHFERTQHLPTTLPVPSTKGSTHHFVESLLHSHQIGKRYPSPHPSSERVQAYPSIKSWVFRWLFHRAHLKC